MLLFILFPISLEFPLLNFGTANFVSVTFPVRHFVASTNFLKTKKRYKIQGVLKKTSSKLRKNFIV